MTIFSFSRFFKFTFFFSFFFSFSRFLLKSRFCSNIFPLDFFSFFFLNHFHEFAIFWDTLYVCVDLQFSSSLCKFNAFFKVQMEEGYISLVIVTLWSSCQFLFPDRVHYHVIEVLPTPDFCFHCGTSANVGIQHHHHLPCGTPSYCHLGSRG